MRCFRKPFLLPLFAALALLPRPSYAVLIPTYDLESLCYMSTAVVEAAIVRHHVAGQEESKDTFTATVVFPIAGQYRVGGKIGSLDLTLYDPAATGQPCILFIARKQFYFSGQPSETISPRVTDVLLLDKHGRVRRYFQWSNPGGMVAEGYVDSIYLQAVKTRKGVTTHQMKPRQEDDAAEQTYPTLAAERSIIAAKWAAVGRLRPLLARKPTRADIPALQALVRERRYTSGPGLQNVVGEVAQERLAELNVKSN